MTIRPGEEPRPGPARDDSARPGRRGLDPVSGASEPVARPGTPGRAPGGAGGNGSDPRRGAGTEPGAGRNGAAPSFQPRDDLRPADPGRGERGPGNSRGPGAQPPGRRSPFETGRPFGGGPAQGGRGPRGRGAPGAPGGPRDPRAGARGARPDPGDRARTDEFGVRGRGGAREPFDGLAAGLLAGPLFQWIGRLKGRQAALVLLGFVLAGMVGTVATNHDPGGLLGFMLITGSVVTALAVQRRAVYKLIPLPAIGYLVAAILTGAYHDRAIDTSKTEFGLSFLVWLASGFFWISAATILVLLIAGGRWLVSMQLVSGQFPMSRQRLGTGRPSRTTPAGPRPDRDPRADRDPRVARDSRDPWGDPAPRDGRAGRAPASRDPRDQSDSRDRGTEPPRPRY